MNLWLIKFGKALSALRREGLFRGGKRIFLSFMALFRRVGSGDVLFITGGLGDSARYRTEHVAEALELHGLKTSVTVQDNPFLSRYAGRFSIFVFHRVMYTGSVAKLIQRIKERHGEIIFETDDLVFDSEYFQHMDHYRNMNYFERKQYQGGVGAEILADPYVNVCTASTSFLVERLAERGKKVFLVRNVLSQHDVTELNRLYEKRKNEVLRSVKVVIGYFSGAKGHDKDFATIAPVLGRILNRYPQVELFLAGPLDVGDALEAYAERIWRTPYVPRFEHFANIAHTDINLAPLEVGNPFCESKSELKWFEAGIVGVPTVASATAPFREAITDGADGYVATNESEWQEKLTRLIEYPDERRRMGERARQTVLARYTTDSANDTEYYEYLKSKVR